jgi:hypothetical protein
MALAFPPRPAILTHAAGTHRISRFSRMGNFVHALVLRPRGVHRQLALSRPVVLPSADPQHVGTPDFAYFAAQ